MKIFITGSAGFVGSSLVKQLEKNKNFEITRHTRQVGALNDKKYLKKSLSDQDIIIHAAAILNPWGEPSSKFIENNISPTKNLIDCAPKKLKQFIFISSVHVLGVKHGEGNLPLNEQSSYKPSTQYAKSKVLSENIVKEAGQSGLPFTILRPAIVYGPGDKKGMVPKIINLTRQGKMILPCSGENTVHFIYIDDLIRGIIASMNNPRAFNQTFILAGPQAIKMKDFLYLAQNLLGAKRARTLPYFLSFCVAKIFKLISSKKREPIIHPDRLDIMCGNRAFSTQKAQSFLNWQPRIDYKQGLQITATTLK